MPSNKYNKWEVERVADGVAIVLAPFLLVPASGMSPMCPLLRASAVGSTVIVATRFVTAVVEYVCVAAGSSSAWAAAETKTSAAPGAGTGTVHVFADWSQLIVWIASGPERRPSAVKRPPNVCACAGGCEKRGENPEISIGLYMPGSPK